MSAVRHLVTGSICGLTLALGGCSTAPPSQRFVLRAAEDPGSPLPSTPVRSRLQVRRVTIPDYLDSTDIIVRRGAHEIAASPTGRWGERLSTAMAAALQSALARRLPEVLVEGGTMADSGALQLFIDVSALDAWADGRYALVATWRIAGQGPGAPTITGSGVADSAAGTQRQGPAGDAAVVEAIAAAVGGLAGRIADSVRALAPAP